MAWSCSSYDATLDRSRHLIGGVASVLLAATLGLSVLARFADKMVAFAVGVLLTFSLTDILPEAVHLGLSIEQAGWIPYRAELGRTDAHGLGPNESPQRIGPVKDGGL